MEVVASLSQGRTAAAQCGLFTHKSVPVIFEPPCRSTEYLIILCYYAVLTGKELKVFISKETAVTGQKFHVVNTDHTRILLS